MDKYIELYPAEMIKNLNSLADSTLPPAAALGNMGFERPIASFLPSMESAPSSLNYSAAHIADQAPAPLKRTSFVNTAFPPATYLQYLTGNRVTRQLLFMNGLIQSLSKIHYEPSCGFENGFLMEILVDPGNVCYVFIPKSEWKKRKMLNRLQAAGIQFIVSNIAFKIDSLCELLAPHEARMQVVRFDPRPGISVHTHKYVFACNALPVPSLISKAVLPPSPPTPADCLEKFYEALPFSVNFSRMLRTMMIYALFFTAILDCTQAPQEKMILFSCPNRQVMTWFRGFFHWFGDPQSSCSLSSEPKKMAALLENAKDSVILVDLDGDDLPYRRGKNMDLLKSYIFYGRTPSGAHANAIVIFLSTGYPYALDCDDALIFDISSELCESEPSLRYFNFQMVKCCARCLIDYFNGTPMFSVLRTVLHQGKNAIDNLAAISQIGENTFRDIAPQLSLSSHHEFQSYLVTAQQVSAGGSVPLFLESFFTSLRSGKVCVKRLAELSDPRELKNTIVVMPSTPRVTAYLFFSDFLLQQLLSSTFSPAPSVQIFRQHLDEDGFLVKSAKMAQAHNLQMRIRLRESTMCRGTGISIAALQLYKKTILEMEDLI